MHEQNKVRTGESNEVRVKDQMEEV